jgi:Undecaprenyl-phosphate glucose phosphotransferase
MAALSHPGRSVHIPWHFVVSLIVAFDLSLATTSFFLADIIFHQMLSPGLSEQAGGEPFEVVTMGIATGIVLVAVLMLTRAYTVRTLLSGRQQARSFAMAWLVTFFVLAWVAFLTKSTAAGSRGTVTVAFALGLCLALPLRLWVLDVVRRNISNARLAVRRAFVIHAEMPDDRDGPLARLASQGIAVVGEARIDLHAVHSDDAGAHFDEAIEACSAALRSRGFDAVYILLPWWEAWSIARLTTSITRLPVPVYLFADDRTGQILDGRPLDTGLMRGFEIQRAPLDPFERAGKRAVDLVVSGTALFLLAPLLAAIALVILVESGRPILFRQTRRGFGQRTFQIYKFRTMKVCEDGPEIRQAQRGDARVTRSGRFLRASSLDELPQLINILRGEMSLVGPRPHAVAHDNYYMQLIGDYAARHRVKPGLTGWAQVNGFRGETKDLDTMKSRIEHDIYYIANCSIWLDMYIILRTAVSLAGNKNAY